MIFNSRATGKGAIAFLGAALSATPLHAGSLIDVFTSLETDRAERRDFDETLPPVVVEEAPTVDRETTLLQLKAGLVEFRDLSKEDRADIDVIVVALSKIASAHDALCSVRGEHLQDPRVQKALFANAILLCHDELAPLWMAIVSTEIGRDQLMAPLFSRVTSESLYLADDLHGILSRHCPLEQRDVVLDSLKNIMKEAVLTKNLRDFASVPPCLEQDQAFCQTFVESLRESGKIILAETLARYGLSSEEISAYYKDVFYHPAVNRKQLLFCVADDFILEECKELYLSYLQSGTREAFGRLSENLIKDEHIRRAATVGLEESPVLISALTRMGNKGLGENTRFAREMREEFLTNNRIKKKIVEAVLHEDGALSHFADEYVKDSFVAHHINLGLNRAIAYDMESVSLPSSYDIRAFRLFPQYLKLCLRSEQEVPLGAYRYNPSGLLTKIRETRGHELIESEVKELLISAQVGEVLGIREFGRFDNGYEIIRNRYAVAGESDQARLRQLFGEEYFAGITHDDRPLCVIVYPASDNDHNGAFLSQEHVMYKNDPVDLLCSYYHVLYYEASDESDTVKKIIDDCRTVEKKCQVFIPGGHGHSAGISLGRGKLFFDLHAGEIDITDKELLQLLGKCVAEEGSVILESCSTGAEVASDEENIASVIYKAMPHAHVYAPMSDAAGYLQLNEDGSLASVEYIGARRVHYKTDGSIEKESRIASYLSDFQDRATVAWQTTWRDPWKMAVFYLAVVGGLTLAKQPVSFIFRVGKNILPFRRRKQDDRYVQRTLFDID